MLEYFNFKTMDIWMKLFGTDGVRGEAGSYLSAELAMKVAMAAGIYFKDHSQTNKILIGKDTRISGYMIENAIVAGLTAIGYDVIQIGPMTGGADKPVWGHGRVKSESSTHYAGGASLFTVGRVVFDKVIELNFLKSGQLPEFDTVSPFFNVSE